MRVTGVLMVGILIAAGFVLYLTNRDATESLDAVATISADLREEGVAGRPLDRTAAARMITAMEALVAAPDQIPAHVDDLKSFAATAAAWAQEATSPSPELSAAVALRSAAGELREHAIRPAPTSLTRAGRYLDDARAALAGEGTGAGPGLATDAVRDRLQNLQRSQQEQQQELAEELNR